MMGMMKIVEMTEIVKDDGNCERWRFVLPDRGLDYAIHFARHRHRQA